MIQKRRWIAGVLCALCLVGGAAPALAQQPAPAARAEFEAAQKLFDQGRQAEALPRFRKAYEASKSPNARLMIARCLIAMGKTTEAYEEMAATTREATLRAEADPKYAHTRDAAAAELALLERRVGRIVVALTEPGAGTIVTLNGAPLAVERVGAPVAVEPGTIVIEASRPGSAPSRREVTIGAGETKTVAFSFSPAALESAAPVGPRREPSPPPPAPVARGGGVRVAGFVVAGLGLAGMGVFAGAGILANSKFSSLETACGGVRCTDPKYASTVDSGKTLDLVANIGLATGVAGIVGGTLMIALGGPAKATPPAAVQVGFSGTGLAVQGSF